MSGLKRDNNEAYYTNQEVSKFCISKIKNLHSFDVIIEPSAGNGSFLKELYFLPKIQTRTQILAYDIDPKYDSIIKQDFLTTKFDNSKKILVLGNPPFGRQSSLAKKFIRHCCLFADTIAFILPKSFMKDSMTTCFEQHFHKTQEYILPEKSFLLGEKEHSVPCVFQIWVKKASVRESILKQVPNKNYTFVNNKLEANLAFKRVGVYAGTFYDNDLNKLSQQSHYFISTQLDFDVKNLNKLVWPTSGFTVGPKSISKQELIKVLNKELSSKKE